MIKGANAKPLSKEVLMDCGRLGNNAFGFMRAPPPPDIFGTFPKFNPIFVMFVNQTPL